MPHAASSVFMWTVVLFWSKRSLRACRGAALLSNADAVQAPSKSQSDLQGSCYATAAPVPARLGFLGYNKYNKRAEGSRAKEGVSGEPLDWRQLAKPTCLQKGEAVCCGMQMVPPTVGSLRSRRREQSSLPARSERFKSSQGLGNDHSRIIIPQDLHRLFGDFKKHRRVSAVRIGENRIVDVRRRWR